MADLWANSGMGLSTLDRYEEATDAVQHAVDLGVKWLGARHPRVAHLQINLGMLLIQQKRLHEALPLAEEAVTTYASQSETSSGEARARMFLGRLYLKLKDYGQARRELEQALEIGGKVYGSEGPELAGALIGMGELFAEEGQYPPALDFMQHALNLQQQALGPKHFALGETLLRMGKVHLELEGTDQAIENFERVLRLREIEQNAPITAETRFALASTLEKQPRAAGAGTGAGPAGAGVLLAPHLERGGEGPAGGAAGPALRAPLMRQRWVRLPPLPARSLRLVTHGLDVVTVRIEHKGAIVVGVVLRPQTRRAVVLAACRYRRLVKGVHCCARGDSKRNMDRRCDRFALADPEIGPVRMAEACTFLLTLTRGRQLDHARMAGGCERLRIEGLAFRVVSHDDTQVINHWGLQKENQT